MKLRRLITSSIRRKFLLVVAISWGAMPAFGLDFGGMYGRINGRGFSTPNIFSGACPSGHETKIVRHPLSSSNYIAYCWRNHQPGIEPVYDYGGMYGHVDGKLVMNSVSGQSGCPAEFRSLAVTISSGSSLFLCYREHSPMILEPAAFGGLSSTGIFACPLFYTKTKIARAGGWELFSCDKKHYVYLASDGGLHISEDGGNTFSTRTTAHGLPDNRVYDVAVEHNAVAVGTYGGLSMSRDHGRTFQNKTGVTGGLGMVPIGEVQIKGGKIYALTADDRLCVSEDLGNTFRTLFQSPADVTTFTVAEDGSIFLSTVKALFASRAGGPFELMLDNVFALRALNTGSDIYLGTKLSGLGVSHDGGLSFAWKTYANSGLGLDPSTTWNRFDGSMIVYGIAKIGSRIYVASYHGVSESTDGGNSFSSSEIGRNQYNRPVIPFGGIIEANGILYVGTSQGLYFSTNGGKSFTKRDPWRSVTGESFISGLAVK